MEQEQIQNLPDVTASGVSRGIWWTAIKPILKVHQRHRYRYYAWDQAGYRFWTNSIQCLLILILLAAGAWLGRHSWRRHQERLTAGLAVECLSHGDYAAASRNATRALALNPADVRVCRVMAEVATVTHLPAELVWWQRTAALAPTIQNKLALAEAALHCQAPPFPLAVQILDELAAIGSTNASYQETAATIALNQQQFPEAEARLTTACALAPANQAYALNLAVFRLDNATASERPAARARLAKLAVSADLRPIVLRALVTDLVRAGDQAAAYDYSTQLLATGQATPADQLQHLGILQQLKSDSFVTSLAAAEKLAEASPLAVAQTSDWMRAHGLVTANIDWLSQLPDYVLARPLIAASLTRSYLQNGNWQSLLDFASHGDWDDLEYLRLAAVSHAWSELGMPTLAESNWGEAVLKASYHEDAVTNLLAYAEAWQLTAEVDDLRQRERQLER